MLRFWRREEEKEEEGPVLGGIALGPRPWLVLGGGGLKGLTHLGVLRTLRNRGFEPAGILGTSIGALAGACAAAGRDLDELVDRARKLRRSSIARIERRALWVNGFRAEAFFQREPLFEYIESVLPDGWESLETRFQANAVELGTGRTEWFGIGARTDVSLAEAVYASAALPVFYPPAPLPGGYYVDGGAEYALPIHRAAELGATGIVAVDPGSSESADAAAVAAGGILSMHQRVFSIMSGRIRRETIRAWSGPPLLYLRPRLEGYGTFDFEHVGYFLDEGERMARETLGDAGGSGADATDGSGGSRGGARGDSQGDSREDSRRESRRRSGWSSAGGSEGRSGHGGAEPRAQDGGPAEGPSRGETHRGGPQPPEPRAEGAPIRTPEPNSTKENPEARG